MKEKVRKSFIDIAETMAACAYAQKNWDDKTFKSTFNCTKNEALINNITIFAQDLRELEEQCNTSRM